MTNKIKTQEDTNTMFIAKPNTIPVFLDMEQRPSNSLSDKDYGKSLLVPLESRLKDIGQRYKNVPNISMLYYTDSVKMYNQAKELYCLGYFEPSIIVCRSVAEYLAFELFVELIDLKSEREKIELIAENIDFRKIVNNFLYDKTNPLIDKKTKELFNKIYDVGNRLVHPKSKGDSDKCLEEKAKEILESLTELMRANRNILNDMVPVNGFLCKKPGSRNYRNGIKLAEK